MFHRWVTTLAFVAGFALVIPLSGGTPSAIAGESSRASHSSRSSKSSHRKSRRRHRRRASRDKKHRRYKVCKTRHGKRRCSYTTVFAGHNLGDARLRETPLNRPSGDIVMEPVNFSGEEYKVHIYDPDGGFDDAALAELDHGMRCKRTGNERAIDPRLYEMMSRIYDHFGRKPIMLVSGHRYQKNEKSRHFHGSAMDIRIEGVSIRRLYDYASSLDEGGNMAMGVGIYPNSGFVHVDFRAPGAKSYRWTDYSGPGHHSHKKRHHGHGKRKPLPNT